MTHVLHGLRIVIGLHGVTVNHGPTIGIAYTFDFKKFYQCENAFLPFNRNGVLFPEKINGKYAMLSRPSDNGHTPFGDIYISFSPDMKYWGEHRCVMKVTPFPEMCMAVYVRLVQVQFLS